MFNYSKKILVVSLEPTVYKFELQFLILKKGSDKKENLIFKEVYRVRKWIIITSVYAIIQVNTPIFYSQLWKVKTFI